MNFVVLNSGWGVISGCKSAPGCLRSVTCQNNSPVVKGWADCFYITVVCFYLFKWRCSWWLCVVWMLLLLSNIARSILGLLMPRLFASPGRQEAWYFLCKISRSLSCFRVDANHLNSFIVEEWDKKWKYILLFTKTHKWFTLSESQAD